MNEKVFNLTKSLEVIQKKINEEYPFCISLKSNKNTSVNNFIITIDKKAYKKYSEDILKEFNDHFWDSFNIKINLQLEKEEKKIFSHNIKLHYKLEIN